MRSVLILLISMLLVPVAAEAAQTPAQRTCERDAAHPTEPELVFEGVELGRIDVSAAMLACGQALEEAPDDLPTQFRYARVLIEARRYPEGMQLLFRVANAGYPPAEALYGNAYLIGLGAPQDFGRALQWIRKAAEHGNLLAQNNLGTMYADGSGVFMDKTMALYWYRRAAEQGYPPAQVNMGSVYRYGDGEGVEIDYAEAVKWYKLAAAQNSGTAKAALGYLSFCGCGLERDVEAGWSLIEDAARIGDPAAFHELEYAYRTDLDLSAVHDRAIVLLGEAADRGYADAMAALGYVYEHGIGADADPSMAFNYYLGAAQRGNMQATVEAAQALMAGEGVQKDEVSAEQWLLGAASKGYPLAAVELVRLYVAKSTRDLEAAGLWAEQAGYRGVGEGFIILARFHLMRGEPDEAAGYAALALRMGSASEKDAANAILRDIHEAPSAPISL